MSNNTSAKALAELLYETVMSYEKNKANLGVLEPWIYEPRAEFILKRLQEFGWTPPICEYCHKPKLDEESHIHWKKG